LIDKILRILVLHTKKIQKHKNWKWLKGGIPNAHKLETGLKKAKDSKKKVKLHKCYIA